MSFARRILLKLTSSKYSQRLLEKNIKKSLAYSGIGTGGAVLTSGERVALQKMKRASSRPYCVFDVGANKGQFLGLCLDVLKSVDRTIHCFEPSVFTYRILLEKYGDKENVKFNNFALGKMRGEVELHYDSPGSGLASLTKRRLDHFDIQFDMIEKVSIDTIDNYCKQNKIDKIDLLKVDVEGHELDVLNEGANLMFGRKAINMVSFEFGGCNVDTRSYFQDFYYFFMEVGMRIYRITPSGYLFPINKYKELYEQFMTTNYLAVREDLNF